MRAWRRLYGASPFHLAIHLAAFGIAGYALLRILRREPVENFLLWFVGAALLHDLVLLPLYSSFDLLGLRTTSRHRAVPVINHVRVPALISGLLLLVYFPLILVQADRSYFRSTGHHVHDYARNWLLVTGALFAGSALIYLGRTIRARRRSVR